MLLFEEDDEESEEEKTVSVEVGGRRLHVAAEEGATVGTLRREAEQCFLRGAVPTRAFFKGGLLGRRKDFVDDDVLLTDLPPDKTLHLQLLKAPRYSSLPNLRPSSDDLSTPAKDDSSASPTDHNSSPAKDSAETDKGKGGGDDSAAPSHGPFLPPLPAHFSSGQPPQLPTAPADSSKGTGTGGQSSPASHGLVIPQLTAASAALAAHQATYSAVPPTGRVRELRSRVESDWGLGPAAVLQEEGPEGQRREVGDDEDLVSLAGLTLHAHQRLQAGGGGEKARLKKAKSQGGKSGGPSAGSSAPATPAQAPPPTSDTPGPSTAPAPIPQSSASAESQASQRDRVNKNRRAGRKTKRVVKAAVVKPPVGLTEVEEPGPTDESEPSDSEGEAPKKRLKAARAMERALSAQLGSSQQDLSVTTEDAAGAAVVAKTLKAGTDWAQRLLRQSSAGHTSGRDTADRQARAHMRHNMLKASTSLSLLVLDQARVKWPPELLRANWIASVQATILSNWLSLKGVTRAEEDENRHAIDLATQWVDSQEALIPASAIPPPPTAENPVPELLHPAPAATAHDATTNDGAASTPASPSHGPPSPGPTEPNADGAGEAAGAQGFPSGSAGAPLPRPSPGGPATPPPPPATPPALASAPSSPALPAPAPTPASPAPHLPPSAPAPLASQAQSQPSAASGSTSGPAPASTSTPPAVASPSAARAPAASAAPQTLAPSAPPSTPAPAASQASPQSSPTLAFPSGSPEAAGGLGSILITFLVDALNHPAFSAKLEEAEAKLEELEPEWRRKNVEALLKLYKRGMEVGNGKIQDADLEAFAGAFLYIASDEDQPVPLTEEALLKDEEELYISLRNAFDYALATTANHIFRTTSVCEQTECEKQGQLIVEDDPSAASFMSGQNKSLTTLAQANQDSNPEPDDVQEKLEGCSSCGQKLSLKAVDHLRAVEAGYFEARVDDVGEGCLTARLEQTTLGLGLYGLARDKPQELRRRWRLSHAVYRLRPKHYLCLVALPADSPFGDFVLKSPDSKICFMSQSEAALLLASRPTAKGLLERLGLPSASPESNDDLHLAALVVVRYAALDDLVPPHRIPLRIFDSWEELRTLFDTDLDKATDEAAAKTPPTFSVQIRMAGDGSAPPALVQASLHGEEDGSCIELVQMGLETENVERFWLPDLILMAWEPQCSFAVLRRPVDESLEELLVALEAGTREPLSKAQALRLAQDLVEGAAALTRLGFVYPISAGWVFVFREEGELRALIGDVWTSQPLPPYADSAEASLTVPVNLLQNPGAKEALRLPGPNEGVASGGVHSRASVVFSAALLACRVLRLEDALPGAAALGPGLAYDVPLGILAMPTGLVAELSPALCLLLAEALHEDPAKRCTADALLNGLRAEPR